MIGHDGGMDLSRLAPLIVVALALGACSSVPTEVAGEPKPEATVETKGATASGTAKRSSEKNQAARKHGQPLGSKNQRAEGNGGEEGAEDDSSSAYYPASGTYVYTQSGYEEFCDTSGCDKADLPSTQDVKTTHKERSSDTVIVVTEARSSDSRLTRTTTAYSAERALITNVQVKFNYEGFQFDNSYQPDPPVESVRYPLRSGRSWSGTWNDSTSGDYSIDIGPARGVSVGGQVVQAYPLRTQTTFRGEFDGTADIQVWIDPATAAVVKMSGELRVESVFGSYHTEFTATLRSAPGY